MEALSRLMSGASPRVMVYLPPDVPFDLELNVSQGGNLFLHVPEDVPKALPHLDTMDRSHRHALEVEPGSLMERVYGEGEIRVNSMHHMAIDEVAPGFIVASALASIRCCVSALRTVCRLTKSLSASSVSSGA